MPWIPEDRMGARFLAGGQLAPWQLSPRRFDFDMGFCEQVVKHLNRYRSADQGAAQMVDAKAWINKGFFDEERLDKIWLLWEEYQSFRPSPPAPLPKGEGGNPAGPTPDELERARARQRETAAVHIKEILEKLKQKKEG